MHTVQQLRPWQNRAMRDHRIHLSRRLFGIFCGELTVRMNPSRRKPLGFLFTPRSFLYHSLVRNSSDRRRQRQRLMMEDGMSVHPRRDHKCVGRVEACSATWTTTCTSHTYSAPRLHEVLVLRTILLSVNSTNNTTIFVSTNATHTQVDVMISMSSFPFFWRRARCHHRRNINVSTK